MQYTKLNMTSVIGGICVDTKVEAGIESLTRDTHLSRQA